MLKVRIHCKSASTSRFAMFFIVCMYGIIKIILTARRFVISVV